MPFKKMTFSGNFISYRFFGLLSSISGQSENSLPTMRGASHYLAENAI